MKPLVYVFPDTNAFLHFPPMKDVDWRIKCDAECVQLVVCMTVIHELDEKKADSRLSARAERAIKEIRAATKSGDEIRDGVVVRVFNREVRATDFPDTLNIDSADDRIVHLVKLFRIENPEGDVAIATGDYGMELRAPICGIPLIDLEPLRLPNPQDEQTKKYHQAVKELNAIKNRHPSLSLALARPDGQPTVPHEVDFELDGDWKPRDVDADMEIVMQQHPKRSESRPLEKYLIPNDDASIEMWEKYDARVGKFYKEIREYLEKMSIVEDAKARSFGFDLWLVNDGNGLATDIDVLLRFPPEVWFVAERGSKDAEPLEKEVPAPEPPERPNPFAIAGLRSNLDWIARLPASPTFVLDRRDEWTPSITVIKNADQAKEIQVKLGRLKHGHPAFLGKFILVLASWDVVKPFHADFAVSTSELTDKTEGQLHFVARLKRGANDAAN